MNLWLGTTPAVFLGCTVVLMGLAAYATGRAVANTWGPITHVLIYCSLLSLVSRFLIYALFQWLLLSPSGWLSDWMVLNAIGIASYRAQQVRRMVKQYPWLYTRSGLFRLSRRGDAE